MTAKEVQQEFVQSILTADARRFRAVVDEADLVANPISDEQLSRFLRDEFSSMTSERRVDPIPIGNGENGQQIQMVNINANGNEAMIAIPIGNTPSGLKVVQPFAALFTAKCGLEGGDRHPLGIKKLKNWLRGARKVAPRWKQYGITKIQLGGPLDYMTTDRYITWTEERIQRAERGSP